MRLRARSMRGFTVPALPVVAVLGFPRSVYPPDAGAQGKKPSVDGPDCIAYKRAISRAGRWPWGSFDDSFSNAFSHGKSGGNVGDSGVAGVQRQSGIEASGWIGKQTFNLLRSIRIPVLPSSTPRFPMRRTWSRGTLPAPSRACPQCTS